MPPPSSSSLWVGCLDLWNEFLSNSTVNHIGCLTFEVVALAFSDVKYSLKKKTAVFGTELGVLSSDLPPEAPFPWGPFFSGSPEGKKSNLTQGRAPSQDPLMALAPSSDPSPSPQGRRFSRIPTPRPTPLRPAPAPPPPRPAKPHQQAAPTPTPRHATPRHVTPPMWRRVSCEQQLGHWVPAELNCLCSPLVRGFAGV